MRLGRDKASEPLLGRSLLQRVVDRFEGLVDEVVLVKAQGQELPPVESSAAIREVEDVYTRIGPLGGLYTGLSAVAGGRVFVAGCDMPLLQPALIAELLRLAPGLDAVVPVNESGLAEPLCAVYGATCLPAIEQRIRRQQHKLTDIFEGMEVLYVRPVVWRRFDPEGLSFLNVNNEEDLRRVEQLLRAETQR
jgi:molybdopterin-guanine dinucleotide biosynthesis protein A